MLTGFFHQKYSSAVVRVNLNAMRSRFACGRTLPRRGGEGGSWGARNSSGNGHLPFQGRDTRTASSPSKDTLTPVSAPSFPRPHPSAPPQTPLPDLLPPSSFHCATDNAHGHFFLSFSTAFPSPWPAAFPNSIKVPHLNR